MTIVIQEKEAYKHRKTSLRNNNELRNEIRIERKNKKQY